MLKYKHRHIYKHTDKILNKERLEVLSNNFEKKNFSLRQFQLIP